MLQCNLVPETAVALHKRYRKHGVCTGLQITSDLQTRLVPATGFWPRLRVVAPCPTSSILYAQQWRHQLIMTGGTENT
jgi:hypothetical protein